jgi:hypothetical protein
MSVAQPGEIEKQGGLAVRDRARRIERGLGTLTIRALARLRVQGHAP